MFAVAPVSDQSRFEKRDRVLPRAYAPACGRLAAAMATIWASRRPIRDGAARNNEPTFRMTRFPSTPRENRVATDALGKMGPPGGPVETTAKIAMRASSGPRSAVELLLPFGP